jgi:hypothetical protein
MVKVSSRLGVTAPGCGRRSGGARQREHHPAHGDTAILSKRAATTSLDGNWPRERFEVRGVNHRTSDKSKSHIYRDLLPLINGGRIELLDHQKLIAQLCSLERTTARGGRDSIDHPRGAHDDVANSVAGAIVYANAQRGGLLFPGLDTYLAENAASACARHRHYVRRHSAAPGRDGHAVAVVLAVSMRSAGYDQFAILTAALVVWIILPFVILKAGARTIAKKSRRFQRAIAILRGALIGRIN